MRTTVNSLYSGHCRDLQLVSSLARVRSSGSLFQSNVCNLFFAGDLAAVRIIEVSARRELTVLGFFSSEPPLSLTEKSSFCCVDVLAGKFPEKV